MPYFLIIAFDRENASETRIAHRQEHLDYWMAAPGLVKLGGAIISKECPRGSALIVEAPDEQSARQSISADPFNKRGVFSAETEVIEFRPSIGEWLQGK